MSIKWKCVAGVAGVWVGLGSFLAALALFPRFTTAVLLGALALGVFGSVSYMAYIMCAETNDGPRYY